MSEHIKWGKWSQSIPPTFIVYDPLNARDFDF